MDRGVKTAYDTLKNSSVILQKIISLIQEQITKNDIQRQEEFIEKFVTICKTGFFMRDIHDLMSLLHLLLNRIDEVEEYSTFLDQILHICSMLPVMTVSSDVLTFARSFREYFATLGYVLVALKKEDLQTHTANAIISLLTKKHSSPQQVSLEARINSAVSSRLPEILAQFLQCAEEHIYPYVLNITMILVKESDKICKIFIEQDALNFLLTRLEPTWRSRFPNKRPPAVPSENVLHYDKVAITMLLLLRYMANNKSAMKDVENIRIFSLWNLQYAFRLFARTNQPINRNNILIILLKLVNLFPDLDFVKSGLAKDLTAMGFNSSYMTWSKDIKLSSDDNDCLYLELLLSSIPLYLTFFGGIRVLEEQRVVYHLLTISRNKFIIKWNPQQSCVLSYLALNCLMKIVPNTEEDFIENGGPIILLNIIRMYKTNNIQILILSKCLEAVLFILKNTLVVLDSILFNNGLDLILELCEHIVSNSLEDNLGKKCTSLVFFILDMLYQHSTDKKGRVIAIIITYMKRIAAPHQEVSVRDIREILSVMNFTWEHIVKHEKFAKEFVKRGGTFLMLDIIQKFPFVVKIVTLGALVDLCEFGRCIPYIITWKRNGERILPMLMKLFRDENNQLKVKRGHRGEIIDVRYPLMGKDQWFLTFCTCKPMTPGNACISDLFISCRPKIYALLQMLQMRYAEEVQIANEHYKLYSEELKPKDQVTKLVAENFLALKLGEAWIELQEEFNRSFITLTSIDQEILSTLTTRANKLVQYLQSVQNEIIQNENKKNQLKEYKLYKHLAAGKLTDALEALSELKSIARSSENMFRISEKYKQSKQIEDALKSYKTEAHGTYFTTIRVTPVFNENINLPNDAVLTAEENELVPVSPVESTIVCDVDIPEDLLESNSQITFDKE